MNMILDYLQKEILPQLLEDLPFLKKNSIILLYGSAVTGKTTSESDIDVMLIVPAATKKRYREKIYSVRNKLLIISKVELSFPFTFDDLEPKALWNNDMLLDIIKDASVLFDTDNKFQALKKRHQKYPQQVLKDKIMFAFYLLLRNQQMIISQQAKGNKVDVIGIRARTLKIIMILIRLFQGEFFNAKNLYSDLKQSKNNLIYLRSIDDALNNVRTRKCDKITKRLTADLEKEAVKNKLIPKRFVKEWEKWPIEKLSYTIKWNIL